MPVALALLIRWDLAQKPPLPAFRTYAWLLACRKDSEGKHARDEASPSGLVDAACTSGRRLIVLANIGDASVVAATGGVYGALESAGAQDNVALRNDLYATVLRLKEPWAAVNLSGFIVLLLSFVALVIVWRKRE